MNRSKLGRTTESNELGREQKFVIIRRALKVWWKFSVEALLSSYTHQPTIVFNTVKSCQKGKFDDIGVLKEKSSVDEIASSSHTFFRNESIVNLRKLINHVERRFHRKTRTKWIVERFSSVTFILKKKESETSWKEYDWEQYDLQRSVVSRFRSISWTTAYLIEWIWATA